MKRAVLLLCILTSVMCHGMQDDVASPDELDQAARSSISDDRVLGIIETTPGVMLGFRCDEISAQLALETFLPSQAKALATTRMYGSRYKITTQLKATDKGYRSSGPTHFMLLIAQHIAEIERTMCNLGENLGHYEEYEKTRVGDLYLLKTAIASAEAPYPPHPPYDEILRVLGITHQDWPSQGVDEVNSFSGYTALKELLLRKIAEKNAEK